MNKYLLLPMLTLMCASLTFAQTESTTLASVKANSNKLSTALNVTDMLELGDARLKIVVSLTLPNEARELAMRSLGQGTVAKNAAEAASMAIGSVNYDLSNQQIRNELAVSVKQQIDSVLEQASQFNSNSQSINKNGSEAPIIITNKFKYTHGFAADVSLEGLAYLLENDKVILIEENLTLYPQLNQGISVMNGAAARTTYNGSGVAVAIADTGVDDTHPDLNGGKVLGGYDFGDDDIGYQPNGNAHGTAVAGIVAGDLNTVGDYIGGVAPGC